MMAEARAAATPVAAAPGTRARIIGLDGARGLSCLGVAITHVTGHFSPHTAHASKITLIGMSLIFFYVLSGFLLFLPYVRNLTEERASATIPSTKNFALHRFARIVPGYLAIFLLCNFAFRVAYVHNPALQTPGTDAGTGMITNPWQLLANLTLVQPMLWAGIVLATRCRLPSGTDRRIRHSSLREVHRYPPLGQ